MFTKAITRNGPEQLGNTQVPKRARYVTVIMLELSLFCERELTNDLFKAATSMRMMHNYFCFGEVVVDLPYGVTEYKKLITRNPICLEQVEGVGIIGPMLRASGIQWDLVKLIIMVVMMNLIGKIHKIIPQALEGIPGGPYLNLKIKKPSPTFELAKQEFYVRVEAPKRQIGNFSGRGSEHFSLEMGNSPANWNPLKRPMGIIWLLVPIFTLVLGITIGVLGYNNILDLNMPTPWKEPSFISRRWSFIQYRNLCRSHIHFTKLFGNSFLISPYFSRSLYWSVFLWIAISSIAPIGLHILGYASSNKYSLLGGLRAAAQSISYEMPLTLCVLPISQCLIRSSTFDMVESQYQIWFILPCFIFESTSALFVTVLYLGGNLYIINNFVPTSITVKDFNIIYLLLMSNKRKKQAYNSIIYTDSPYVTYDN
ncbi:hypothetical protein M9H77_23265 [Catharanthus roseus]|uniref:Uncharacterized protein n=1 Tax=Catharanthus roseus TaxID=4058 RepID=A0ACC0ASG4_CATRO|nr:hypothetical protein M9H77_23265 [Catharanthus roseus]